MKLLTDNVQNGILSLNEKSLEPVKATTFTGKRSRGGCFTSRFTQTSTSNKFDVINADLVKRATEQEVEQDHQEWMPMGGEKF